jgi:hypothetical protein
MYNSEKIFKKFCQKIKWHLFFELQFFFYCFYFSTLSYNSLGKISAHLKNTPLYIMFYKMYANAK